MRLYEFSWNPATWFTSFKIVAPPSIRSKEVADIQKVLVADGEALPRHGVDGILGPETKEAIKQYQGKYRLMVTGEIDQDTVANMNKWVQEHPGARLVSSTDADVKPAYNMTMDVPDITGVDTNQAKGIADQYLGRVLQADEWNYLLRATAAEASNDPREQAYVAGVILNRVASGKWGGDVTSVLTAKNQFHAVTGTSHSPGASSIFRAPGGKLNTVLAGIAKYLPEVPHTLQSFTAASSAAYGPGTNIGYRGKLLAKGGIRIGGTIFA